MGSKQPMTGESPVSSGNGKPAGFQEYTAFPEVLRRKEYARRLFVEEHRPKRRAVLVLHGIGAQKPYATLDQFARGLRDYFKGLVRDWNPTQEIRFRQHKANLNTNQKDWTQAFVRIRPDAKSQDVIDVYEYYWAPVITGKVSAFESLKFLILAGLSPFQYLRDNLIVIDAAKPGSAGQRLSWLYFSFLRELFRMLFIFIPAIAISLGLLWLLAKPLGKLALGAGSANLTLFAPSFFAPDMYLWNCVDLAALAIRILLVGMCLVYLLQEVSTPTQSSVRKSTRYLYGGLVAGLLAVLLVIPHLPLRSFAIAARTLAAVHPSIYLVMAGFLAACIFRPKILRSAWRRAWENIKEHPWRNLLKALSAVAVAAAVRAVIQDPHTIASQIKQGLALRQFISLHAVATYAFLALVAFVSRRFLTTAVGCLAVYLGSDDLSKNFAARSQILHECTDALIGLLTGPDENGKRDPEWDYDEVLVAGHSLGSVIAYDSLTELVVRKEADDPALINVPLERIKGLLTFGCPLNKVVYFFRTRTKLQTNVLSQILYLLHPFKLRTALPPESNPALSILHPFPPASALHPQFKWFNAYSPFDIISGRMQFYNADLNVAVEHGVAPWTAHLSYWENKDLYNLFMRLL